VAGGIPVTDGYIVDGVYRCPVSEHYVYVLRCADDTLYTGYTTDVDRRVAEHDAGEGAKYTRGRTPVTLVHVERHGSRSAALRREHEIKTLSRDGKEALIDGPETEE
jgi:putative endonuclease